MQGLTKLVLRRPVTTILALVCLLVFGWQSVSGMKLEQTPDMDMPMYLMFSTYNGASPLDVTELVTKPIEDTVTTLSGLDSITSRSSEGMSIVFMQYEYGTDMDEAYDNLKKKLDVLKNDLPEDATEPMIMEMSMSAMPDMTLVIKNDRVDNLYNYVEDKIVPELEKLSSVAEVSATGGAEEYIKVELLEDKVAQYNLTMNGIAQDIAAAKLNYPAGTVKVGSQDVSLSTKVEYDEYNLLKDIPISVNGGTVYLSDIANIYKTTKDKTSASRYNGEDVISVSLTKQQSETAISMANQALQKLDDLKAGDASLDYIVTYNAADNVKDSLFSVGKTLIAAVVISMLIILLFFGDMKASLIVGSSIPVSILAAVICMAVQGLTLNIITLASLTLGVGMMVDNSIVVLESCFRVSEKEKEKGLLNYMKAALDGTGVVSASVSASTATTCVVFLPLALMKGLSGQQLGPLGFTIVYCMVASLISSIAVVPLCYMLYKPVEKEKAPLHAPVKAMQEAYRDIMQVILRHRLFTLLIALGLLILSIFLATQLDMELMSSGDGRTVTISIETRPGLGIEKTDAIVKKIEEEVQKHPDVESYTSTIGSSSIMSSGNANISVELKEDREMETKEVVNQWKKTFGEYADCNVSVTNQSAMSSQLSEAKDSFSILLEGTDYDDMQETVEKIAAELAERPEVQRVHTDTENSSPVIEIQVDAIAAKANGLSAAMIGNAVYQTLSGTKAIEIEENGQTVDVRIEYPDGEYESLEDVRGLILTSPTGKQVAITDVADIGFHDSPAQITRYNKSYQVEIKAEYTDKATEETKEVLRKEVVEKYLTSEIVEGKSTAMRYMATEFAALGKAILTATFLVFVVMAMQFESPKFSFMVMFTIPFSLIGSFGMLWLSDVALSMTSIVGFLILIGTVVNSGILYVDTVNQYRVEMSFNEALIEAGATRMRPILMTTLTTILSMLPLALDLSDSSATTKGLAMVNIGGLTASTILSLLMRPALYSLLTPKSQREKTELPDID